MVEKVLAAAQRRALAVNDNREKKQRACQPLKEVGAVCGKLRGDDDGVGCSERVESMDMDKLHFSCARAAMFQPASLAA